MSMLVFMPWCPIEKNYNLGNINILPFHRHERIEGVDELTLCHINTILSSYKGIQGKPVKNAGIIQYKDKNIISDLTDNEIDFTYDLISLACFSSLAAREYFHSFGNYCNSDTFALHIQKFDRPEFTALTTRRPDGRTYSSWSIDEIVITIPVHCHTIHKVIINENLLSSLVTFREQIDPSKWARWQNSLTSFNWANSGSTNVSLQMEWVLLCSAFQQLLEAKSDWKDIADKFAHAFTPNTELLGKDSPRQGKNWEREKSVRYHWMKEFYGVRGDLAHGKLETSRSCVWDIYEHLLLGIIAFPLLVRNLLHQSRGYTFTEDEQAQIDVFEQFASTQNFLIPPSDQKNQLDTYWNRLVRDRSFRIAIEKAANQAIKEQRCQTLD